MKVLFYTDIPRAFRTTLIGYLYEIAHVYPVVLLSEKLDENTARLLQDKTLFPKLEKIIPVPQFAHSHLTIREKNRNLYQLAKKCIEEETPDVVIATGVYPFETYLRRFAKRIHAPTISAIGPIYGQAKERRDYHILNAAYQQKPTFLPLWARVVLTKLRKYAGHVLSYWMLPLLMGEKPFLGEPSFPFHAKYERYKKGADYYLVFLEKDYDALVKVGVPPQKLILIAHPLEGSSRNIFEKLFSFYKKEVKKKLIVVMWPDERIGFKRNGYALIPKEIIEEHNKKMVFLIARVLKEWDILIKPHPTMRSVHSLRKMFATQSHVTVVDPKLPVDTYIERAHVIIGLPPVSTTLYTASLQCPQKPILSVDFQRELLGNSFKHVDGIEYIDNETKFITTLKAIRNDTYQKERPNERDKGVFLSINEVIKKVYAHHLHHPKTIP